MGAAALNSGTLGRVHFCCEALYSTFNTASFFLFHFLSSFCFLGPDYNVIFSFCFSVGHVQQVRADVGINNTTSSVLISKQDNKKKYFLGPFLDFRQRFSFKRSYHQSPSFACFVYV